MTDNNNHPPPPSHFIQPWHVVLGDTSCRNHRTTTATKILRDIKRESRKKYFGQKKDHWVPLAIEELQQRLAAQSFDGNSKPNDIGLVLIKCTPKTLKSGRVAEPYVFGYRGDTQAWYGIAKTPISLEFFLTSRDGPQLGHEIAKHQENLQALQKRCSSPCLDDFAETLHFFQKQVQKAEDGDELAAKLLESLKPINPLREQWKMVQQQCKNSPHSKANVTSDTAGSLSVTEKQKPNVLTENRNSSTTKPVNSEVAAGFSPVAVDTEWEVDLWDGKEIGKKAFYPIEPLAPPDAVSLSDKDTTGDDAFHALVSQVDASLDLDNVDVDGFMADLELADEHDNLTMDKISMHHALPNDLAGNPKRRNRSNSDASSVSSRTKHTPKRSRTTSLQATVAAMATLATFVAVSKTSFGPGWTGPRHDMEEPHPRFLQSKGTLDDDLEPLEWGDDDNWCKRQESNPFARLGDLGEFLCSIDFGGSFHSRKENDEDKYE
uniref:Uncharacterized protein n=1 Tax=Amphora coffeiformis TaxID=265554 RepID=A0A7S3L8H7_9STRA